MDDILSNPDESLISFAVSSTIAGQNTDIQVAELLAKLARPGGTQRIFESPYCFSSGRCVEAGQAPDEHELLRMCDFVDGIVEKTLSDHPLSADRPAVVPPVCQHAAE